MFPASLARSTADYVKEVADGLMSIKGGTPRRQQLILLLWLLMDSAGRGVLSTHQRWFSPPPFITNHKDQLIILGFTLNIKSSGYEDYE